jgi:hypothetical protein
MLRFKATVKLTGLWSQMVLAATVVDSIYVADGTLECWITSANDSRHSERSWHYKGRALDFRTKNYVGDKQELLARVKECLGPNYDVVLEAVNTENEHLHVEYDPKG